MKSLLKKLTVGVVPKWLKKIITHDFKQQEGIEFGYYHTSYSQQGEDLHLKRFFENKQNGFYVDIGAFHPHYFSNTQIFYHNGWSGINIEPNPEHFHLFTEYRKRDINVNVAVGNTAEELTYYRFNMPALNGFDKNHVNEWQQKAGFHLIDTLNIPAYSLSAILEKHLPAGQQIDFMSVDTEGWDLKVLQSNNWDKFRPTVIVVETELNADEPPSQNSIFQFMTSVDYSLWCITGGSWLFKNNVKF